MNKELRGAIYRKQMLYSQYTKTGETKIRRNLENKEIW